VTFEGRIFIRTKIEYGNADLVITVVLISP